MALEKTSLDNLFATKRVEPIFMHRLEEIFCQRKKELFTDDRINSATRANSSGAPLVIYPLFDLRRAERRAAVETSTPLRNRKLHSIICGKRMCLSQHAHIIAPVHNNTFCIASLG